MSREDVITLYNKWCTLSDKIRFFLVGGFNAAFSYVIFSVALYLIGQEHYQKVFVFCTKGHWLKEYLKCCTTWVVSYICNALILELIVRFVTKNVYIGQIFSILLASVITYVLFKYFAFRHHKK